MGELPVYYPSDEEVYLRAADMPDNKYILNTPCYTLTPVIIIAE